MGKYFRLVDVNNANEKEKQFLENKNRYYLCYNTQFTKIPGNPIVYWASEKLLHIFEKNKQLAEMAEIRQGLITGDNNKFLRQWYEVSNVKFSIFCDKITAKWFPINKGGIYRKWYGNREYVLNYANDGMELKNFKDDRGKLKSRPQNLEYNFRNSISWGLITTNDFSVRYYDTNFTFNVAGIGCFINDDEKLKYVLALSNCKIFNLMSKMINPTLNSNVGDIEKIPIIYENHKSNKIKILAEENILFSKKDWDLDETSWDFEKNPLI